MLVMCSSGSNSNLYAHASKAMSTSSSQMQEKPSSPALRNYLYKFSGKPLVLGGNSRLFLGRLRTYLGEGMRDTADRTPFRSHWELLHESKPDGGVVGW